MNYSETIRETDEFMRHLAKVVRNGLDSVKRPLASAKEYIRTRFGGLVRAASGLDSEVSGFCSLSGFPTGSRRLGNQANLKRLFQGFRDGR